MVKFINELRPKISRTTLRTYIRYLKTFFNFLVDEEIIVKSPINRKIIPGPEYKQIVTFDQNMLNKILIEAKARDDKFYNALVLLGATGIRPCDLVALKAKDIDLENEYINIRMSKTSREIHFPIYDSLKEFFQNNFKELSTMKPDDLLFKGFTVYILSRRFRRLKQKLGIHEKNTYTLKTFRKTFATSLVDKEFDGLKIADLLGHTSINTTSKYYLGKRMSSIKDRLNKIDLKVNT